MEPLLLGLLKKRVFLNGKYSSWAATEAGITQASILRLLFFLMHVNDLSVDLAFNLKLFAGDASLFSVVENMTKSANDLNNDLATISTWLDIPMENRQKRLFLGENR